jgi:hypothetical protein
MGRKIKVKTRKGEPEPRKKSRMLAIILKEGKSTYWKWVNTRKDSFTVDKNLYFIRPEGTYISKNKVLLAIYVEGVSTPINHTFIKRKRVKRTYEDPETGNLLERFVDIIEGLKFDSKLIDMLLNRKLADEFTKSHMDLPNLIIIILIVANIVVGVAGLGAIVHYLG